MKGRRGQFTIFVVLGFVLVASFAFLLFARSIVVQDKIKSQADDIVREAIRSSNINFYVESCLDRVTDDAVYLLSLQGGRLYNAQGGLYDDPSEEGKEYLFSDLKNFFFNVSYHNRTNVSYGLMPNLDSSCINLSPPIYPFANTPLEAIRSKYHLERIVPGTCDFRTGPFGYQTLPPLCDENGPNRIDAGGLSADLGDASFILFGFCNSYGEKSVQEQLNHYISEKIKSCVNFTIFENIGYNITVQNDPSTTVTFSDRFFLVNVTYPFRVKVGRSIVTTEADFELRRSLRIKQVYEYLQALLEQEYKDLEFDLINDYRDPSIGWDEGMRIIKTSNPCTTCTEGQFDDLYQLVDNETQIRGNPLIFQFAVKNRAPALDFIDSEQRFNIVVKEGERITIEPLGLDPDENVLFYNYSGWMETYNATFNRECCELNPTACVEYPERCVVQQDFTVRNWTKSTQYNDTRRVASYLTDGNDLGLHHTLVWVWDEEGLLDYQNVSIMVGDVPIVIASGQSIFDDINFKNASLEDPYILDPVIEAYFAEILQFEWEDILSGIVQFTLYSTEPEEEIPTPDTVDYGSQPLIEYIIPKNFTEKGLRNLSIRGQYRLGETVEWTLPSLFTMEVKECLPHDGNAPPHPYNNIGEDDDYIFYSGNSEDPFQANHTCCNISDDGWGNITKNNICYYYQEYGYYEDLVGKEVIFKSDDFMPEDSELDGIRAEYTEVLIPDTPTTEQENNVWMINFTRTCDGTRGNICMGDSVQDMAEVECADTPYPDATHERCQGPAEPFVENTLRENQGCQNYDSTTFEALFKEGTGSCNYEERCVSSDNSNSGYSVFGTYFFCNATCNGAGDCTKTIPDICRDCRTGDTLASESEGSCTEGQIGVCSSGCTTGRVSLITKNPKCLPCPDPDDGDKCYFEYESYDSNSNGEKESCRSVNPSGLNPDISTEYCGAPNCGGASSTYDSGRTFERQCCGDDSGEALKTDRPGAGTGCCLADECSLNGVCVTSGTVCDGGTEYTCNSGSWTNAGSCTP